MQKTDNLELNLPDYEDDADIEKINENFEKIDTKISELDEKTETATETNLGMVTENRIKEISQENVNENKAHYNFTTKKFLNGLINSSSIDTNIPAHINFHRGSLEDQNHKWWENLSKDLKSYGWDMRLYSSIDGTHLGVHKTINNSMYYVLDSSLFFAGGTPNFLNNVGGSKIITCDQIDTYVTNQINFFDGRDIGKKLGQIHYSSNGTIYHKGPRTNWGFSRILDEADRTDFDGRFNDLFNRHNTATVWDLRFAGYINPIVFNRNEGTERNGYVVTGIVNYNSDGYIDSIQMRALQMFKAGTWWNVPFA